METKTINLYEFKELGKNIQEKVLNEFRERNEHYFLNDFLKESLNNELENNNIKVIGDLELFYSLSYCQGDGLSFIGSFEYKNITITAKQGSLSNFYCHSDTIDLFFEDENGEEINDDETFKNLYHSICQELEEKGYSEIEENNSDESIKEDIERNEYKFRSNGEIENN